MIPETRPITRREELIEKLKRFDEATAAFNALYVPWGQRDFAYPIPDGYQEALDVLERAEHAIHVTAIDDIRELLRDAADLLRRDGDPQLEVAFKAGYHCQWHKGFRKYTFDPGLSPGDPDGAFAAWRDAADLLRVEGAAPQKTEDDHARQSSAPEAPSMGISASTAEKAAIAVCERCQMRLPERLVTFGIGVRGGTAARCAACSPQDGPEGESKRQEVIDLRRRRMRADC